MFRTMCVCANKDTQIQTDKALCLKELLLMISHNSAITGMVSW